MFRSASTPQPRLNSYCTRVPALARKSVSVTCSATTSQSVGYDLKVTSFNILAPIYNRICSKTRESDYEEKYLPRNEKITKELLTHESSIICLQEFWHQNEDVAGLYKAALGEAGYELFSTPRTNGKGDGLLTCVSTREWDTVSMQPIPFFDCADRVAQMTHLASKEDSSKQVIVVNNHLIFPYNSNSTLIQMREVYKVLEFLANYMEEQGLNGMVEGKKGVPIILCGDWNGEENGAVAQFLKSQGFVSSYDCIHSGGDEDDEDEGPLCSWVSHLHRDGSCAAVDFMWLLNPSQQMARPLAADWKAAIFAMIMVQLHEDIGVNKNPAGYRFFKTQEGTICQWPMEELQAEQPEDCISREAFGRAIDNLGLTGPGSIGLIEKEIDQCYNSMDQDGNMVIDYDEFVSKLNVESFGQAYEMIKKANGITEGEWAFDCQVCIANQAVTNQANWFQTTSGSSVSNSQMESDSSQAAETSEVPFRNLTVQEAILPDQMAQGSWDEGFELSDHAQLQCCFSFAER